MAKKEKVKKIKAVKETNWLMKQSLFMHYMNLKIREQWKLFEKQRTV